MSSWKVVLAAFSLLAFGPARVAALDIFGDNDNGYFAPPLETASLAVDALLIFLTLIELILLLSYLCRGRAVHMIHGVLAIFGALFLFLSYILFIFTFVGYYTVWGNENISRNAYLGLINGA